MNTIINAISSRTSFSKLKAPAPKAELMSELLEKCLHVPDHAHLRPWRFISIEGAGLEALGAVFAEAKKLAKPEIEISQDVLDKMASKALRAPLILVAICQHKVHEKVPKIEQQLSTGCILQNLSLSLDSLGFASVWRTGGFASDTHILKSLGLTVHESIVGFLYIGTADGKEKVRKPLNIDDHLKSWP